MKNADVRSTTRWRNGGLKGLFAVVITCCLLFIATATTFADTVHIYDQANVLNTSQVQSEASALRYPVDIYTTNTFNGSSNAFYQQSRSHVNNRSNLIVMAIDISGRHFAVTGGPQVPISQNQYDDARNAFQNSFGNSGYTGATIAALRSLQNAIASNGSSSGSNPNPVGNRGFFGNLAFAPLCCIGLLVLAGIAVFAFVRRRRFGGFGRGPVNPTPMYGPQQQPYNQPYNQGYPPNYGPGYNQGGGINPWAAGGLGAVGGGLAGYELGRMQGEREGEREGDQGN